jgi:alginate O-acetyltransferase complex protein AlgI
MIFNTVSYYVLFLLPAAVLFKLAPMGWRPLVLTLSACFFYLYFSMHGFGGVVGAFCLSIFLRESLFSRLYRPAALVCLI